MKKSEYSGLFGDYSSYSAEYDEIADPDAVEEGPNPESEGAYEE
jgi:spermidine/putrescine transport system ATP-binding protein